MSPLIWATLLFSAWGINVNTGTSGNQKPPCEKDAYCVTLRQEEITAEAGLCVVIPCSFTTSPTFTSKYYVWMKCKQSKENCGVSDVIFSTTVPSKEVQPGFRDRVSLLEPDVRKKNCSIIINDLTESDSGSYQFRVEGSTSAKAIDGFTFSSKTNVSVTVLTQKPTVMIPPLTEGLQSTLSCTAPGLCSGSPPEITWMWRGGGENESHITGNITDFKTVAQRHSSALSFTPSAKHHGTNITCKVGFKNNITTNRTVTLNVTYLKKPVIVGETTVKEGDSLNLTCTVDSFPPSVITWTKLGTNKSFNNLTGMAALIIPNMTKEGSGKYTCSATNQNKTDSTQTEVNLGLSPRILQSSACVVQSDVLTCVCISEGFPLPIMKWPLLENHNQYSVTTSKTKHSVNSNITVSVKDHNYTTVVCVSINVIGEVNNPLKVITKNVTKPEVTEHFSKLSQLITQPQVIIAFFIGVLLTATICCLIGTCHRKKPRRSGNMALDNLEMMNTHADSLMDAGQALGNGGANGGAEGDVEPREVEYSDINISLLERSPRRAQGVQAATESEYAEIKKDKTEERLANDDQNEEILEGNEKEEAMMEEEGKDCVPEKEEGDDVALYSNLKDVMGEILPVLMSVLPATRLCPVQFSYYQTSCLCVLKFFKGSLEIVCLNQQNKMLLLIWLILLFTVERNNAKVASPKTEDITAEAGLCVVIPCYWSADQGFALESAVWYKCEQNCNDSDIILRLNKSTDPKTQSKLVGRVSLLVPDLSRRNCSIVINDLNKSDSGSYELRALNKANNRLTSHRANITVKDLSQKPTLNIPLLTEGNQSTLTCTAPGLCSGSAPTFSWAWRTPGKNGNPIRNSTAQNGQSSTFTFNPSAMHHGGEVTCKVSFRNEATTENTVILNVTYVKEPEITGKTTVTKGDTLDLTCRVDSFPPSVITWTKHGSEKPLSNSYNGSAPLVIFDVNSNHSGLYTCAAKHLLNSVNITVMMRPKILNSSGCINDLKLLTCSCISRADPLPSIQWPLLVNHTAFTVITTTSNHTVNSTFILAVNNQSNAVVECVSSNENGDVKQKLIINKEEPKDEGEDIMKLLRVVTRLDILIAFLIGALLSSIICCSVRKCHRKKHRTHGYLAETLEMVTSQEDPLIDAGQAVENAQAIEQEAPEGGDGVAAGKSDVDYSNLDFSWVKRKNLAEKGMAQETETEYAEIKKGETEERLDGEGKEEMAGEDEETKEFVADGGEGEDLYSNVEDIMGQEKEGAA
ncbi:uncharacterized protein LOC132983177 [Labrus mixtus]|uniref:uncharacterized protein LOC132983177 n=1 Tax=Labrus mixtus TaxID=508554 RepID=UPI0029BFD964|nr:uncharacterized protein LOC132983177 [Labrus mixtus]